MTDSPENLQRKIRQAGDLGAVVKTMKAITASHIGQYQKAVRSLDRYYQTILLGVHAYLHQHPLRKPVRPTSGKPLFIVFGSDQGLVGPFNHAVTKLMVSTLASTGAEVWSVGERALFLLKDAGLTVSEAFAVPGSIKAVTTLTGRLLIEIEKRQATGEAGTVYAAFNRPTKIEGYAPVVRKLLPFDEEWHKKTSHTTWPSNNLPQTLGEPAQVFSALFREYLFTSLYRACVYSLASENTSRLNAMQRAEKNIEELSEQLHADYHQLRQDSIDAELFDIVAGFRAMKEEE